MPALYLHELTGQPDSCLCGLVEYAQRIAQDPRTTRWATLSSVVAHLWAAPVKLDAGEGPKQPGCTPQQRSRVWPVDGYNCWEATAHYIAVALSLEEPIEIHVFDADVLGQRHVFPAVRPLGASDAPAPVVLQQPARTGVPAQALGDAEFVAQLSNLPPGMRVVRRGTFPWYTPNDDYEAYVQRAFAQMGARLQGKAPLPESALARLPREWRDLRGWIGSLDANRVLWAVRQPDPWTVYFLEVETGGVASQTAAPGVPPSSVSPRPPPGAPPVSQGCAFPVPAQAIDPSAVPPGARLVAGYRWPWYSTFAHDELARRIFARFGYTIQKFGQIPSELTQRWPRDWSTIRGWSGARSDGTVLFVFTQQYEMYALELPGAARLFNFAVSDPHAPLGTPAPAPTSSGSPSRTAPPPGAPPVSQAYAFPVPAQAIDPKAVPPGARLVAAYRWPWYSTFSHADLAQRIFTRLGYPMQKFGQIPSELTQSWPRDWSIIRGWSGARSDGTVLFVFTQQYEMYALEISGSARLFDFAVSAPQAPLGWVPSGSSGTPSGRSSPLPGAPPVSQGWTPRGRAAQGIGEDIFGAVHLIGDKALRIYGLGSLSDSISSVAGDTLPDWARTPEQRAAHAADQVAAARKQAADAKAELEAVKASAAAPAAAAPATPATPTPAPAPAPASEPEPEPERPSWAPTRPRRKDKWAASSAS